MFKGFFYLKKKHEIFLVVACEKYLPLRKK